MFSAQNQKKIIFFQRLDGKCPSAGLILRKKRKMPHHDDYYLAAIIKDLNLLVCGNLEISDGDKEIVCFLRGKK